MTPLSQSETRSRKTTDKCSRCKTILAYLLLGLGMPLLNVFLALTLGMPAPFIHDEFSYLFMADTFALGRVVNPEHPLSQFFQTFHIIQHNGIYVSKYFPGIGLQLLAGKLLGHPIIGVWLTIGLFGASLLYFLRQFFSPFVALLVSVICTMQFMVLSYFGYSYWGGSLMALAGVWTLGGAVLAAKRRQIRYAWISGIGLVICLLTRPFGGFFYLIPLACGLLFLLLSGREISGWRWNWRLAAPLAVSLCSGFLLLGIYNRGITGSWTTLPYSLYEKYYAPYGVLFLGEHAAKQSDHSLFASLPAPFHQMQAGYETEYRRRTHHFFDVKFQAASDVVFYLFPWAINWMFVAAFFYRRHWKNGLWQLCVLTMAMRLPPLLLSWSATNAHYSAVWIFPDAVLCAFGLERLLSGKFTRLFAVVASISSLIWLTGLYSLSFDSKRDLTWKYMTSYNRDPKFDRMSARNTIEKYLEGLPHNQLVFVQYGPNHDFLREWVYNRPEIDRQKIVWAHDLGDDENQRLINYYPRRNIWRAIVSDSQQVALQRWNKSDGKFEPVKLLR